MKWLLRDKLSPRWQYGMWSLLALVLLLPAGWSERDVLFPWRLWVETVKTLLTGDYSLTQVTAPVPLPVGAGPNGVYHLIFYSYCFGVLIFLLRYLFSYARLRLALRAGTTADPEQVRRVAEQYGLKPCRTVAVSGVSSAFVCGIFRPVLVLPAGGVVDDKVILHELLHLKYWDVAWGLLACLLRCLHWCNPLLWYCANRAGNDAETLCDQRALERLEGEARRDYGRILLSMADEKYARVPGTSSLSNGGRNIGARIDAIVRFKRYPRGMTLASVCVAVTLAVQILLGSSAQASSLEGWNDPSRLSRSMSAARINRCTTAAGALDAYGKAVLTGNGVYRALCAPVAEHPALARDGLSWDSGLPWTANLQAGYLIYNLCPDGANAYTALMVFPVTERCNGTYLQTACQTVRTVKSADGWVVEPVEDFQLNDTGHLGQWDWGWLVYGNANLPAAATYSTEAMNFRIDVDYQTVHVVDNDLSAESDMSWFFGAATSFDLTPKPNAVFDQGNAKADVTGTFLGSEAEKAEIRSVGISYVPFGPEGAPSELRSPDAGDVFSSNNSGNDTVSHTIPDGEDWDGVIWFGDSSTDFLGEELPDGYAAVLWVNYSNSDPLILIRREGGTA